MLCPSGFTDDVMFSHHVANGSESSTTLCLEEVRQVAVQLQCLVESVGMQHWGVKSAL